MRPPVNFVLEDQHTWLAPTNGCRSWESREVFEGGAGILFRCQFGELRLCHFHHCYKNNSDLLEPGLSADSSLGGSGNIPNSSCPESDLKGGMLGLYLESQNQTFSPNLFPPSFHWLLSVERSIPGYLPNPWDWDCQSVGPTPGRGLAVPKNTPYWCSVD